MTDSRHDLKVSRRALLVGAASLLSIRAASAEAEAYSAAAFIDSVGVNSHVSSDPYASRFATFRNLLAKSGIRHLRDELRPGNNISRWRGLYDDLGVKSHMLVSPATNTIEQMIGYIEALGVERLSAIEGQNEGDSDWFMARSEAQGDWSKVVVAYQQAAFAALRAKYSAAELPIVSPSVIDWKPADMQKIRGAAEYSDYVAIHSYVQHAQEPETANSYAALSWYVDEIATPFKPGAPVMATEMGYNNLVERGGKGVSEKASAIYIPRLYLNNFASGIRRTFLYQFLDGGDDPKEWEHHFGLVRHDDTPKPAYDALSTLLGVLQHFESVAGSGSGSVSAKLGGASADTRFVAFTNAAASGSVLALWRAVPCWDVFAGADIEVEPFPVVLKFSKPARARWRALNGSKDWHEVSGPADSMTVAVGADVVLIDIVPAG